MKKESIEQRVVKFLSSPSFGQLKAYYNQATIFNVIGVERSENRHSAFLRWLFCPDSSHGLGTEPLKLFLRLVATLRWGAQTFGEELYRKVLAGSYDIELIEPLELEKNVGELGKSEKKQNRDRIDIWMVACLTYEEEGQKVKRVFPIVIENKIYSGEGPNQTQRYYDAMVQYISTMTEETGMNYSPIGVLLSPDGKNPACGQFVNMTYQQLLDYVLVPVLSMTMPPTERSFVETYIRNLGRPSDAANHDYSPLAVSDQERNLIKNVYQVNPELIDEMLMAVYGDKAEQVIDGSFKTADVQQQRLLQEVWDANDDLFKVMAYQHYIDKKEILAKLFKGNNRDNSKYRVYYGKKNTEVFSGKRLSKAMAACAIFKAYLLCRPETSLEQLREAFPCKDINAYYWDNYYADLFYLYPEDVNEAGEPCLEFTAEKRKGQPSLAKWDFNLCDERLLPVANGTQKAMCVKLWRKGDFDRLLEHVEKQGFSDFITIEECL
jgi:hypothetical protein